MARTFQRGLLPLNEAKNARFKFAEEYGFTFPTATYPIDKSAGITNYGMDGNGPDPTLTVNDGRPVGDCGPCATPAHANMITAVLAGLPLDKNSMTSNDVVTLYFTYEAELAGIPWRPPATGSWVAPAGLDNGVDLGDWLLWLFKQDLVKGFVKIQLSDLDAALATFDVVIVGVNLNPNADEQCENGVAWNVGPGDEPDAQDGHAVLYLKAATSTGPFVWCTWGQQQPSTLAWKTACPQQAFAVVTDPDVVASFYNELVADLTALNGT
jgi:hypothetical protein